MVTKYGRESKGCFLTRFCLFLFVVTSLHPPLVFSLPESTPPHSPSRLTPVILIPGISRSVLRRGENGPIVWGNYRTFFSFHDQDELALPIGSSHLRENRDALIAYDLMKGITVIPFLLKLYANEEFFKTMKRQGYQLGDMDNPKPGDNFFVFTYDWRRDNVETAELLAAKIENLKVHFGENTRFDLIASCAASLTARYYVLYGGKDVLDDPHPVPDYAGARNIRKLLLVSPPHRGTALAFQVLHQGFRALPVPFIRKYTAYEAFTAPAFFELLPSPEEKIFVDHDGRSLNIDLYDASNWVRYGWSVFSRKESRRLQKKIQERYPHSFREKMLKENKKRLHYLETVLKRAKSFKAVIDEETHPFPPFIEVYSFLLSGFPTFDKVEVSAAIFELKFGRSLTQKNHFSEGDSIITLTSMRGRYKENPPYEVLASVSHRRMVSDHSLHQRAVEILQN